MISTESASENLGYALRHLMESIIDNGHSLFSRESLSRNGLGSLGRLNEFDVILSESVV